MTPACRVCGGHVREFFDFGRQPISDTFIAPDEAGTECFFRLAIGICDSCAMVQLLEEVPRHRMFHADYLYYSSSSDFMTKHFGSVAQLFMETELTGADPFIVEIGSNDGVMLRHIAEAGIRHVGVDPAVTVSATARAAGVRVCTRFFEESSARELRAREGPADVIFSANTTSHIAYVDSVFRGVDVLLADDGVLVLEDRYLGDIIRRNAFDQIYDEHFYLFSVRSVCNLAARFGFELVDAVHLPVHGGTMRYTVARRGRREVGPAVGEYLAQEETGLTDPATLENFAANVDAICADLMELMVRLHAENKSVVGYGATSKSATVVNYSGLTADLVPYVCDSTPAKQGKLLPASHIPIRPPSAFRDPYPDYALLFAWNHAEEIMAKERVFHDAGGKWILYIPDVHIV
ncbi:class I SAM-dependent methyltransferase [Nocardia transvalensis]|uniref:class I SAM-dependent methyltransferase n=1 Tax=Nocardia transvalensis TaxID=37333 RepID=UPI001892E3DB|nr:class I SAM-dependent methyltransferase [Nocardia transvalensis]MBF6331904.1 class I SAM-dependent methyltransferase [Nocardia transvalensis]